MVYLMLIAGLFGLWIGGGALLYFVMLEHYADSDEPTPRMDWVEERVNFLASRLREFVDPWIRKIYEWAGQGKSAVLTGLSNVGDGFRRSAERGLEWCLELFEGVLRSCTDVFSEATSHTEANPAQEPEAHAPADIGRLLQSIGLEQYIEQFRDEAVDLKVLRELNDDDLKEIGVGKLGHRKKILRATSQISSRGSGRVDSTEEDSPGTSFSLSTAVHILLRLPFRVLKGVHGRLGTTGSIVGLVVIVSLAAAPFIDGSTPESSSQNDYDSGPSDSLKGKCCERCDGIDLGGGECYADRGEHDCTSRCLRNPGRFGIRAY